MKNAVTKKGGQIGKTEDKTTDHTQNSFQRLSFQRTKKILTESGLDIKDDQIVTISDLAYHLADLIIKNYISNNFH